MADEARAADDEGTIDIAEALDDAYGAMLLHELAETMLAWERCNSGRCSVDPVIRALQAFASGSLARLYHVTTIHEHTPWEVYMTDAVKGFRAMMARAQEEACAKGLTARGGHDG